jgi:hypothetical protein
MENAKEATTSSTANVVALLWLVSLVVVGGVSFFLGKSSSVPLEQQVAGITTIPTQGGPQLSPPPNATIAVDLESICQKVGPSQKKDYLVSYILKEGDSFNTIAEKELGDPTRVSELAKLNEDQRNLTVGSTIYLPPPEIKSSSGSLVEVSGKIVKKDNASWQLTYGGGKDGPGIWIPAFYLKDIQNLNEFEVGDCITVFLDNGVKAYSITKSN